MKFTFYIDPIYSFYKTFFPETEEDKTPSKPLEVPTTEIGTPIPVLWGTRILKSPSIAWYGDITIIKRKVNPNGKK